MTTLEYEHGNYIYTVRTNNGRIAECYRQRRGDVRSTPIDRDELPFLVLSHFEARINESLDGVPPGLFLR